MSQHISLLTLLIALLSSVHSVHGMPTGRLYLSGTDAEHTKSWQFFCSEGQNSGRWQKIQVPCSWELQGFGAYTYGRFYKKKGLKPSAETGRYRTTFTLPASWSGKVLHLVFEGCMTDTQVWIDGQLISTLLLDGRNTGKAVHQGGFTEFEYDITQYVSTKKKHTLEVLVKKESDNKSVNSAERRADWWLFGGIYRPVYITAAPKHHIYNVRVNARQDGAITAQAHIAGEGVSHTHTTLSITDATTGATIPVSIRRYDVTHDGNDVVVTIEAKADGAKAWDPEHPNLYNVKLALDDKSHEVVQRTGFRTIEFRRRDGIYLNGTRLIVKGTNRHCFWPETGRAVSQSQSINDARLIKQMNMNAVRCHYPSDRHFMDACDSLGLLYLDEVPGWQTHYDDSTAQRMVNEVIARDVNRACVFLWSNGNEGGWNTSVDTLFAVLDPQHRHVVHPWSDYDGIDTHHYPAYQTGAYRLQNGQNIFMPTEFLHSKYDKGGGAALEDMWSHWQQSPLFAGGFIWAFVDEAVRRTDLNGILDSDGGNGPDGCLNAYRQPEGSFYTIRQVWSPVQVSLKNIDKNMKRAQLLVENNFLFTSLSECMINGSALPDAKPGERVLVDIPYVAEEDVLHIVATRGGEDICEWTWPVSHADEQTILPAVRKADVDFDDRGLMTMGDLQGPLPVGIRAECIRHSKYTETDGTIVNTFWYQGGIDSIQWRLTPNGLLYMDATLLNDERGHGFNGQFITTEGQWQLGLSFRFPEELADHVEWLGRGPYRVWRNRLQGQQFGIWRKEYNNTITGQYNSQHPPLYPEFKGYHADVRWMQIGSALKVYSLTDGLYVRLFTPEEATDQTPGEMGGIAEAKTATGEKTMIPFPDGDISFLISIPPMRSYKPLEQLGPQSQPDNIRIKAGDEGFHLKLVFQSL